MLSKKKRVDSSGGITLNEPKSNGSNSTLSGSMAKTISDLMMYM